MAALDSVAGAITRSAIRLSADGALNQKSLSLRFASAPPERLEPDGEAERFRSSSMPGSARPKLRPPVARSGCSRRRG